MFMNLQLKKLNSPITFDCLKDLLKKQQHIRPNDFIVQIIKLECENNNSSALQNFIISDGYIYLPAVYRFDNFKKKLQLYSIIKLCCWEISNNNIPYITKIKFIKHSTELYGCPQNYQEYKDHSLKNDMMEEYLLFLQCQQNLELINHQQTQNKKNKKQQKIDKKLQILQYLVHSAKKCAEIMEYRQNLQQQLNSFTFNNISNNFQNNLITQDIQKNNQQINQDQLTTPYYQQEEFIKQNYILTSQDQQQQKEVNEELEDQEEQEEQEEQQEEIVKVHLVFYYDQAVQQQVQNDWKNENEEKSFKQKKIIVQIKFASKLANSIKIQSTNGMNIYS